MENPIKMDDLGGKPTIFGNIHLFPRKTAMLNIFLQRWSNSCGPHPDRVRTRFVVFRENVWGALKLQENAKLQWFWQFTKTGWPTMRHVSEKCDKWCNCLPSSSQFGMIQMSYLKTRLWWSSLFSRLSTWTSRVYVSYIPRTQMTPYFGRFSPAK